MVVAIASSTLIAFEFICTFSEIGLMLTVRYFVVVVVVIDDEDFRFDDDDDDDDEGDDDVGGVVDNHGEDDGGVVRDDCLNVCCMMRAYITDFFMICNCSRITLTYVSVLL